MKLSDISVNRPVTSVVIFLALIVLGVFSLTKLAIDLFGKSFRSPGHVPICSASNDLLKDRSGHTELSVSLMAMANLIPVATGCEMMGDDGYALSKEKAVAYAEEHGHVYLEGKEIIEAWRAWSE